MTSSRRPQTIAVLALIVLVVSGCGSDKQDAKSAQTGGATEAASAQKDAGKPAGSSASAQEQAVLETVSTAVHSIAGENPTAICELMTEKAQQTLLAQASPGNETPRSCEEAMEKISKALEAAGPSSVASTRKQLEAGLKSAKVKIDGDKATVTTAQGSGSGIANRMNLIKVDGVWKLDQ